MQTELTAHYLDEMMFAKCV